MHLSGIELLDWIALRRVHEGGVAVLNSGYVHWGRKVPCYLPEVFDRLSDAELTSLLDVGFPTGPRRVVLTPRGLARYQELAAKRCSPDDPEQSSGDCSVPPDRLSSPMTADQGPQRRNDSVVGRWVWSAVDERSHLLDENSVGAGSATTRCEQVLSGTVTLYQTVPSLMICLHCVPLSEHASYLEQSISEDSGRSSVERTPRPALDDRPVPRKRPHKDATRHGERIT